MHRPCRNSASAAVTASDLTHALLALPRMNQSLVGRQHLLHCYRRKRKPPTKPFQDKVPRHARSANFKAQGRASQKLEALGPASYLREATPQQTPDRGCSKGPQPGVSGLRRRRLRPRLHGNAARAGSCSVALGARCLPGNSSASYGFLGLKFLRF
ncbi:uncharacterized protein LOC110306245 [Mus caroli]|uniref:Uncharacterized protein LOC110306245 n=1 Tax=Mus caroli TaxID=10089 RepID=A0A6P5QXS8_MUSCR|nr:uncharacterized protein LOC110306245 [Mus caroli]